MMSVAVDDIPHSTSSDTPEFSASTTECDPNSIQNTPIRKRSDSASSTTSLSSSDYEGDLPEDPVLGWPRLALLMAKTPDFAAFSRFRELNIKSLLYYQVQLKMLRNDLHKQEYVDNGSRKESGPEKYAERADFLIMDENSEQFKLIKKIRRVLKEYNKALLQYSQISALPEPDTYNMHSLRDWLRHEEGGDCFVRGTGKHSWGNLVEKEQNQSLWKQFRDLLWTFIWPQPPPRDNGLDLVVTRPQANVDGLTRWVVWRLIPFYAAWRNHREERKANKRSERTHSDIEKDANSASGSSGRPKRKARKSKKLATSNNELRIKQPQHWRRKVTKEDTIEIWSEKSALRFTAGISTVVACLLPIVAITVLSDLHRTRDLLLCLAGFTVIFAVGLMFLTQGTTKRVEIFTATAAFSAVLVVFISVPEVVILPVSSSPSTSPRPAP